MLFTRSVVLSKYFQIFCVCQDNWFIKYLSFSKLHLHNWSNILNWICIWRLRRQIPSWLLFSRCENLVESMFRWQTIINSTQYINAILSKCILVHVMCFQNIIFKFYILDYFQINADTHVFLLFFIDYILSFNIVSFHTHCFFFQIGLVSFH